MGRLDRIRRGRRLATPEARQRRSEKVNNLQKKFGHGCYRQKERDFVDRFVAYSGQCFLVAEPRLEIERAAVKEIAKRAARDAGYIRAGEGRRLMKLDRIQEAIEIALTDAGFSLEQRAHVIAEVGNDPKQSGDTRLRAAELGFKLTTGYAPSKSANLQVHARADQFFEGNKEKFAKPPPIDAIEGQEK
jgi:hypothetical protein